MSVPTANATYRARVGGTILFDGVFQPRGLIRGRRPPGSSEAVAFALLEWGQVIDRVMPP